MTLTVAKRIIGGFASVTLLLLLLGSLSWLDMQKVTRNTEGLLHFSLPAKDHATSIERLLSKQQVDLLNAYFSNNQSSNDNAQQSLDSHQAQLFEVLAQIEPLLSTAPDSLEVLIELKKQLDTFNQSGTALINAHNNALETQVQVQQTLEQLRISIDDTEYFLEDIIDLQDSNNLFEQEMAIEAGKLQNNITVLARSLVALSTINTLPQIDSLTIELQGSVQVLGQSRDKLIGLNNTLPIANDIDELVEAVTAIISNLSRNNGVWQQARRYVEHNQSAKQSLTANNVQAEALSMNVQRLNDQLFNATESAGDDTIDSILTSQQRTLVVMALSILLATTIGLFTIRSITRPLNQVNHTLTILAQGDLTAELDYRSKDEFGLLIANINTLVGSLRTLISSISDNANQLATAAEQTSAITTQTTSGIQAQRNQLEQVAAATIELSASASEVATSANDTLGEMKQADDETQRMKSLSNENSASLLELAQEVEQASMVINKLHEDSATIGSILDVIRGIADQTNLLALNAAIEAARAGEQGRGFAVVADEVRSLASRTQTSTTEIQNMIEALQLGAQQAVSAMSHGQAKAQSSVDKTNEVNQVLDSIADAVNRVYSAGNHIAQAAQQQNEVSMSISESINQVSGIAEENSTGAEQTASASHQVAQLSEQLRTRVRQFVI
ncbi:methyl-accepting chemotaxis protein [Ferrimonas lipolytica]|uniref:Methyl-accepting chemotaxis protein n=1 Tax=Ferrimonas lipolytica TaxID=2724191 RepID=A0A6H1UG77_9GAMM|nr:methyl-accepting chemotaxis protein [Ferrimonas lipolytica]QIZ77828.1 methyl-accepting chemotaxis protein [Ferrimonas lipolytica]